ncbi:arginine-tRNA-protein transferase [Microdochium trichocladiopsis]|uniref:arginyltransferase n=1 Tax=Microdochium trichocladiopsis TaxID=1682393 RepID=A0A9P8YIN7_9PEZI|nr:arginine-tRNA-protein transferase [Microdochium trichocladiopsis]KAH7040733.1 arginine-tRNA-protein transferase [Microdochium trichocladiopsis]
MDSPGTTHTTPGAALSYITPIGYRRSTHCGYCKDSNRPDKPIQISHSYYIRARSLEPHLYQTLVDRCWRRSGNLLYRPNQKDCCCPHYTIRLDANEFRPSRDHRQALNRFNKHVLGESYLADLARLHPRSREEARRRATEFDLLERLHESETSLTKQPPRPAHSLTVTLETNEFTEEKYECYENYQRLVHHDKPDDISRDGFKRFLCDSPLQTRSMKSPTGQESPLGSYHQCYRLDGKLVAVGVLDLLPSCVSGVYFFYHDSISKWAPGKLSALREIGLAQENGYRYWYPGYYIHTCPKMKYKRDFKPQTILDPESLSWVPFDDEFTRHFDEQGYLDLSRQHESADNSESGILSGDDGASQPRLQPQSEDDLPEFDDALFRSDMPGLTPLAMLDMEVLDNLIVQTKFGNLAAVDLFRWQDEDITTTGSEAGEDMTSPKVLVAEMVAMLGEDLAGHVCLDLTKS